MKSLGYLLAANSSCKNTFKGGVKHDPSVEILLIFSMIGFVLSIISYFKYLKFSHKDNTTFLINTGICTVLGDFIFYVGIMATNNNALCHLISIAINFFYVSAFLWHGVLGVHLLMFLLFPFASDNIGKLSKNAMFGVNIGVFLLGLTITLFPIGFFDDHAGLPYHIEPSEPLSKDDATDGNVTVNETNGNVIVSSKTKQPPIGKIVYHICFLDVSKDHFLYSFGGPIMVILGFNCIVTCISIFILTKHLQVARKVGHWSWQKTTLKICSGILKLFLNLGVLYSSGVVCYFIQNDAGFYFFSICSGLHGVLFFIINCVRRIMLNDFVIFLKKKSYGYPCLKVITDTTLFINLYDYAVKEEEGIFVADELVKVRTKEDALKDYDVFSSLLMLRAVHFCGGLELNRYVIDHSVLSAIVASLTFRALG